MYAFINGRIYTGFEVLEQQAILVDQDKIKAICPLNQLPEGIKIIDLQDANIAPGFIDLQLNGCGGVQFNESLDNLTIETLEKMHQTNLKSGCTSFLPTLITAPDAFIRQAVDTMRAYLKDHQNQALGLHIEGPYLSLKRKGIHDETLIRKPTDDMIAFLCENADVIKIITLAPEEVDLKHIEQLANAGITVSMGHSNATYEEAHAGFNAGIRLSTHLYNAMSQIEGRAPNAVGAIFDEPEVYCGVIADGLHVHWANLRNAHNIKKDKMILVTDASLPTATDLTKCTFGGKTIYYKDGKCFGEDGTLAGSALTMIEAVKNTVRHLNLPLAEALKMATLYPAKAIHVDHQLGSITRGKIANFVIFDDAFNVKSTVVNGAIQSSFISSKIEK